LNQEFYIGFAPSWRAAVVMSKTLPAGVKLVLLVLAEFCSGIGCMTWPGKKTIAELCGIDQAQAEKALKAARQAGWLVYERGYAGGSSRFNLAVPKGEAMNTGCVQFQRSEKQEEGLDSLTLEQARVYNLAEKAALEDPTVVEALRVLGGRITNIRVTGESHDESGRS
jgi:hypothetical protein